MTKAFPVPHEHGPTSHEQHHSVVIIGADPAGVDQRGLNGWTVILMPIATWYLPQSTHWLAPPNETDLVRPA
jgi:hypothetical protein